MCIYQFRLTCAAMHFHTGYPNGVLKWIRIKYFLTGKECKNIRYNVDGHVPRETYPYNIDENSRSVCNISKTISGCQEKGNREVQVYSIPKSIPKYNCNWKWNSMSRNLQHLNRNPICKQYVNVSIF